MEQLLSVYRICTTELRMLCRGEKVGNFSEPQVLSLIKPYPSHKHDDIAQWGMGWIGREYPMHGFSFFFFLFFKECHTHESFNNRYVTIEGNRDASEFCASLFGTEVLGHSCPKFCCSLGWGVGGYNEMEIGLMGAQHSASRGTTIHLPQPL